MAEAQGKTWRIGIRKPQDRWIIEKPRGRPHRGIDFVEWTLHAKKGEAVSAHFQFTDMQLFAEQQDLSRDMTARIPGPGEKLQLKLHKDANRRTNPHYYAVWIRDEAHEHGGEFAVGEEGNPPPEIDVGP